MDLHKDGCLNFWDCFILYMLEKYKRGTASRKELKIIFGFSSQIVYTCSKEEYENLRQKKLYRCGDKMTSV